MSTYRSEGSPDAALLASSAEPSNANLNAVADPVYLWGRAADEYNEIWAEFSKEVFFQSDPERCEHNWPPLDEDDPRCLGCGLNYAEWSS
ncbi:MULTISPECIES: hypothetical protein [unclassified Micromonospora]|uniref:hypothetical protein n=1 Tax=unclassified Micromonospora TaxID=2617518 RepID=UPI001C23E7B6|nr:MULTISPECIES: hypothetical protein [unclassified Micromonospora]MBU8859653.1 hypothetical protein [Micromonospora sp. WMMB482]MDM4779169.1 hypothetical protein [Micromonospora sp. b486]